MSEEKVTTTEKLASDLVSDLEKRPVPLVGVIEKLLLLHVLKNRKAVEEGRAVMCRGGFVRYHQDN